jgi:hemoglobin
MSSQKPSVCALVKHRPIAASSVSSTFPVVVSKVLIGRHAKTIGVSRPSIYEFAGGDTAFLALAAAHHERCLQDPEISHAFSHGFNPAHVENLAFYWAEVFGGPARYSELLGGHSGMLEIHARTGAADDWGERFVACFVQAVDDARLPTDPELRTALRAYMEWATDEVMSYVPTESQVPKELPVPRWGWNGPE